jgi:hypothetical protein
MQAAAGSVSWVAAQPSVLGRCGGGGGAPSASFKGRAGGGGGGGGAGVRGVGVVRCCARAQAKEKRPPRVRKSKEERREMVESFINRYRTRISYLYSLANVACCCITAAPPVFGITRLQWIVLVFSISFYIAHYGLSLESSGTAGVS